MINTLQQPESGGTSTGSVESWISPRLPWLIMVLLAFGLGIFVRASWTDGLRDVLVNNKDAWGTIQTILTVLGIPVAIWWWAMRRQRYPRADLALTIVHRKIQPGVVWLRVRGALTNKGDVKISLRKVAVYVQQVVPPPPTVQAVIAKQQNPAGDGQMQVVWDSLCNSETQLDRVEVEPGEVDVYDWDFFIYDPEVKTVLVYMYLENLAKSTPASTGNLGWSSSIVYDLVESTDAQTPKPTSSLKV